MESILVIDDCDDFRAVLSHLLLDAGYYVVDAASPDQAFQILKTETFQLFLCDLYMPFTHEEDLRAGFECSSNVGIQTLRELIWVFPWTPVIGMTGLSGEEIWKANEILPGVPIFSKPIQPKILLHVIQECLAQKVCPAIQ